MVYQAYIAIELIQGVCQSWLNMQTQFYLSAVGHFKCIILECIVGDCKMESFMASTSIQYSRYYSKLGEAKSRYEQKVKVIGLVDLIVA